MLIPTWAEKHTDRPSYSGMLGRLQVNGMPQSDYKHLNI
jgi:hypothetical protein